MPKVHRQRETAGLSMAKEETYGILAGQIDRANLQRQIDKDKEKERQLKRSQLARWFVS